VTTGGPQNTPPDDGLPKEVLLTAAETVKYTTAFAIGALVFSVDLVVGKDPLPGGQIVLVCIAWLLLGLSSVGGFLSYSRVPIQLANRNFDLEDPFLVWPARAHQVGFVFGILLLAGAIIWIGASGRNKTEEEFGVSSAADAVSTARRLVPPDLPVVALTHVELLERGDRSAPAEPTWRVEFEVESPQPAAPAPAPPQPCRSCANCWSCQHEAPAARRTLNFLIRAKSGDAVQIP
jgi:hypothetical protein